MSIHSLVGKVAQSGPLNQSGVPPDCLFFCSRTTNFVLLVIANPTEDTFEQYPKASNTNRNWWDQKVHISYVSLNIDMIC